MQYKTVISDNICQVIQIIKIMVSVITASTTGSIILNRLLTEFHAIVLSLNILKFQTDEIIKK